MSKKQQLRTVPAKAFELDTYAYIAIDGKRRKVEVVPYTYGTFKRYAKDSRGRKVLQETERALYNVDGLVYRHVKEAIEFKGEQPTKWQHVYRPFTGTAAGRKGTNLPALIYKDGICTGVAA